MHVETILTIWMTRNLNRGNKLMGICRLDSGSHKYNKFLNISEKLISIGHEGCVPRSWQLCRVPFLDHECTTNGLMSKLIARLKRRKRIQDGFQWLALIRNKNSINNRCTWLDYSPNRIAKRKLKMYLSLRSI